MSTMQKWVKLPTAWIGDGRLKDLRWGQGIGGTNVAGLMALAALSHRMDAVTGIAMATYDELMVATSLSRPKISDGLSLIKDMGIISALDRRSMFQVEEYDPAGGWAKMPAKPLYRNGAIDGFSDFQLRRIAELDALKLYYLFVARRDRATNSANLTYDTIEDLSGVARGRVRSALSLLVANNLVHVERAASTLSEHGISNRYRIMHIDPYKHEGTTGRSDYGLPFADLQSTI